jgi:hypothetical protein
MLKTKHKFIISLGLIILILIFTNPSNTDFDRYLHAKGFDSSVHGGRVNYFLVFSIYEVQFNYGENNSKKRHVKCLSVFGNFITLIDKE